MTEKPVDCLVIGAGPAGLTAAIYLARYHLSTLVIDGGDSRASWIPWTRNHAGFPDGISGSALLDRMREQAGIYGVRFVSGRATRLSRKGAEFALVVADSVYTARAVLIATGVVNRHPEMDQAVHDEALRTGLLRYCPICDGYEVTDKRVGVIGTGRHGVAEATFLRSYTADVTLVAPSGRHELDEEQRRELDAANVLVVDGPASQFSIDRDRLRFDTPAGPLRFDSVYPAMGSDIRSELARQLGAHLTEDGCLVTDEHQRTSVAGLFAAGDVVRGLDQISHAMGQGGVAATTMRNDLAAARPMRRSALLAEGISAAR